MGGAERPIFIHKYALHFDGCIGQLVSKLCKYLLKKGLDEFHPRRRIWRKAKEQVVVAEGLHGPASPVTLIKLCPKNQIPSFRGPSKRSSNLHFQVSRKKRRSSWRPPIICIGRYVSRTHSRMKMESR